MSDALRNALAGFIHWGEQQCPCENEQPNPCPLCGASVENLEACKAIDAKFPRYLIDDARAALAARPEPQTARKFCDYECVTHCPHECGIEAAARRQEKERLMGGIL